MKMLTLIALLLAGAVHAQENWSYSDSLGYTVDVVLPYLPPSCSNCIIQPSYWDVNGSTTFASNAPNTSGVFDFFVADSQVTAVHFVVSDGSTMLVSAGSGASMPVGDSLIAPGVDLHGSTGTWVDPRLPTVAAVELNFTTMVAALTLLLGGVAVLSGRRRT
jgi:hypothetical protein